MASIIVALLCSALCFAKLGFTKFTVVICIVQMLLALVMNYLLRPVSEEVKFTRSDYSVLDIYELDPLTMDEYGNCTYLRIGKTKGGNPIITFRSKAYNDPVSRLRTIPGQNVEFVYDKNPSIVFYVAERKSKKDLLVSIFRRKTVSGRIELHTPELLSLLEKGGIKC